MATRSELLDTFESRLNGFVLPASGRNSRWSVMEDERSAVIETEQSIDGSENLEKHILFYWDDGENVKKNAQFYVKDRGQVSEEAVWIRSNDPKPVPQGPTFQQEMQSWLASQIGQKFGNLTIQHIERSSADNSLERGTADVVATDAQGDLVRVSVAIWRKPNGKWQIKKIKGAA